MNIYVEKGSFVKKGSPLVKIQDQKNKEKLLQLTIRLTNTNIQLKEAMLSLYILRRKYGGIIDKKNFEAFKKKILETHITSSERFYKDVRAIAKKKLRLYTAEMKYQVALQDFKIAQKLLKKYNDREEDFVILAPCDGRLIELHVSNNVSLNPGQLIAIIEKTYKDN